MKNFNLASLFLVAVGTCVFCGCSKDDVEEIEPQEQVNGAGKHSDSGQGGNSDDGQGDDADANHEWVDLGLPSGTLWATCNVGASKPEEYGDYFAWGETSGFNSGKTEFSWATYKYYDTTIKNVTKYSYYHEKTELEPGDDAATVNWGSGWQMPSIAQCSELINSYNTTRSWTTLNGVNGVMIISKSNGKRLFLPATGGRHGTSLDFAGDDGCYWSRSVNLERSDRGKLLSVSSMNTIVTGGNPRCNGHSVRPVRVK